MPNSPSGQAVIRVPRVLLAAVGIALAAILVLKTLVFANPAAHFVVDSTADAVDSRPGDAVCRTIAGQCTLRAAVQETNALAGPNSIDVPAGTYSLAIPPRNENRADSGDLDIIGSLTITGSGAGSTVVDAGTPPAGAPPDVHGLDRLFEVEADGGTVGFSGLTLSDGYAAEYGGAIANNSTAAVTVSRSSLTGNVAGKGGGAIDNHLEGTVDVNHSTLSGNFAYESGSALNNNRGGTLNVTNSTVSGNTAAAVGLDPALRGAGAVANSAELDAMGTITVTDSRLSENHSGGAESGAAISNDGAGRVNVEGTTFLKNYSEADGGAVFNAAGEVTVLRSTFSENVADDGGAVYNSVKDGRVTISESSFSVNAASAHGGAIASGGTGTLTVVDSTFSKNSAGGAGGAVLNEDKSSATIVDTTFTENSAGGEGGGMHANSAAEVAITGGAFTLNRALAGGGFSTGGGGQVTIDSARVGSNSALEQGGGILVDSGAVRMVNIDVVGNVADGELEGGGGIAYAGDKAVSLGESATIQDSRIRDNKAKGDGGGIDSRGDGPLVITTTAITGNVAGTGGGIHHVGDAPLDVTRSTLSGNSAESGGGVFSDGDGEATIENSTVSGNRAGQFGGGLRVSSRLTVRSSTVAGNAAASGGGINTGGGGDASDGFVFLANTIIASSPTGGNCIGTMTSRGGNVDSANTCQLRELSDQPGTDPRLGPLADNGGPTQTHALLVGSPAQEKAVCTDVDPCPPVDQRRIDRPQFAGFDAGAYESELAPGGGGTQRCSGPTERPVTADFDSWVSQSAPSTNFGGDSILNVASQGGGNERALVHFSLPSVPPGCRLVGATLRLYSPSAADGRTLEALRVSSDWSESGLTWSNQPATAGPASTAESGLEFREWDVLAQALDMYELGDHGFLLRDRAENGTGAQSFHSREKGAQGPELVLLFDDPDAPPLPGECPTTPHSLSADRDSWVSQASASNNFGSDSTLKVKSQAGDNSRALVRFPLPALPPGCTGVESATLRVEAASAKDGRTLQALRVASGWSETAVTWSSQPGASGPAATAPSGQGTLEWAVTEQIVGMYTSANHGLLIRDAAENGVGDEQTLNSRDKLSDGPPELVLMFDDRTPETTIDSGPVSPVDEAEATFTFSSEAPDAAFECSLDGAAFLACASPHTVRGLTEGNHSLAVRSTRPIRAVDPTPATYDWTVAVPPETTITGPASPSASADGTLSFTADDPSATFECSFEGAPFAACTSPVAYTNLADGEHQLRVRATDPLGNLEPTPASHGWTVAVPPETAIDSGPPALGNSTSASFTFSGTDNGPAPPPLDFECRLDTGAWAACSSGHTYVGLTDGQHTFEVRATDRAGNREMEPPSRTWTVDTVAPEATVEAGPAELTNADGASFGFRADEAATFECRLDGGEWTRCISPHELTGLTDGAHTFDIRATDQAGNPGGVASRTWTVDTVAPDTTIDGFPADPSKSGAARFEFHAGEAASFECQLDTSAWAPCSSPQSYTGLADGEHTFQVRATDGAGNGEAEPASYSWTVDTAAPNTTIDTSPADPSSDRAPRFQFSADEASTFECQLDSGAWSSCSSGHTYAALTDGQHTFRVQATDRAGNREAEPASYSWTVDTVAPSTTIDSSPADPSNNRSPRFEFHAGEAASFECQLDTGAWASCSSPQSYTGLADGQHTFRVQATDRAGNVGGIAARPWTVDTVAPETTIDSAPADPSEDRAPSFEFSANEAATFECMLDDGGWAACSSPQGYTGLTDGQHTFQVRATDRAGNGEAEPASYTWTIEPPADTTAPDTSLTGQPANPSNSATATFSFAGSDNQTPPPMIAFQCRLDSQAPGDFGPCSTPKTYSGLTEGSHTFDVRALDLAGNADPTPATFTWRVDTAAPQTTITAAPAATTSSTSASFSFAASESGSTFECSLDGASFSACSSPRDYTGLAAGAHQFSVRASDAARNSDSTPATFTWTVDTTAPQTTITAAPAATTSSTSASFSFASSESGSTFECSLDGAAFTACSSPSDYAGLAVGTHQFSARARDAAGNADASPAIHTWTISAPQGCGPAATAPAVADAWIDENSPTNNKGDDSILKVQSKGPRDNFRGLVRFALPAVPQGCVVQSATLRLYAASAKTGRTLHAMRLASSWAENQVNWSNQPLTTGSAAATASGAGYLEWNVSSQLQAMYGSSNHGFLIRDALEGQDAEQQFHSREKGGNPPQLVVRFGAAGG